MIEAVSCGGVVIFRGKILLLYKNYRGRYEGWVLPKGTVEPGEEYTETALREVKEESGDFIVNEKDKISKEIKTLDAGLFGENSIAYELKNSNIGMYVLRDVNFEFEGLSAQIDYIICTPAHCYFVECKNMIGDVTINDKGEFSRVCRCNGQKVKEAIYSPYSQALRHIELWRKIWAIINYVLGVNLTISRRKKNTVPYVKRN